MSGTRYLADTNALIYLLSGDRCMGPFLSADLFVSVISKMELLSYHGLREDEEDRIRRCLDTCTILPLDEEVQDRTIELRRKYKIKLPDAIIAATAVEHQIPLLTADRGFVKISESQSVILTPLGMGSAVSADAAEAKDEISDGMEDGI